VFEPVREHNRLEFERLRSKKRRAFLWGLVGMPPMGLLVSWLSEYGGHIIVIYLAALGVAFMWLEVRMTAVFRRDLRERREANERHETSARSTRPQQR
jgi:hypothetical protein